MINKHYYNMKWFSNECISFSLCNFFRWNSLPSWSLRNYKGNQVVSIKQLLMALSQHIQCSHVTNFANANQWGKLPFTCADKENHNKSQTIQKNRGQNDTKLIQHNSQGFCDKRQQGDRTSVSCGSKGTIQVIAARRKWSLNIKHTTLVIVDRRAYSSLPVILVKVCINATHASLRWKYTTGPNGNNDFNLYIVFFFPRSLSF